MGFGSGDRSRGSSRGGGFSRGGGGRPHSSGGNSYPNRSAYEEAAPETVVPLGHFVHACEGEMVCKSTHEMIPYFNAPIYLENRTQIGKIDEILGPINEVYFTVKCGEGIVASSFKAKDEVFVSGEKLLPLERFLPKPKAVGPKKRGGAARGGASRGGFRGASRGDFRGGFRGGAGRGGRGGSFGGVSKFSRGAPRGGSRGGGRGGSRY